MNYLAQIQIQNVFNSPFGKSSGGKTIGDLVALVVRGGFAVSGVVILAILVFAGFSIVAGAGSNNPDSVAKGKQAATNALIGFLIVFCAYWIIRIIEIIVGVDFITAPTI